MRKLLSDSILRKSKTKPDTGRVSISDTKTKGLAVDIRKNGTTFYFRSTYQGRADVLAALSIQEAHEAGQTYCRQKWHALD